MAVLVEGPRGSSCVSAKLNCATHGPSFGGPIGRLATHKRRVWVRVSPIIPNCGKALGRITWLMRRRLSNTSAVPRHPETVEPGGRDDGTQFRTLAKA